MKHLGLTINAHRRHAKKMMQLTLGILGVSFFLLAALIDTHTETEEVKFAGHSLEVSEPDDTKPTSGTGWRSNV